MVGDANSTEDQLIAPWHVNHDGTRYVVHDDCANVVAMLPPVRKQDFEPQSARDANLIAAAPALLALARQYAAECSECGGDGKLMVTFNDGEPEFEPCEECADIRAIIAKAEGRS